MTGAFFTVITQSAFTSPDAAVMVTVPGFFAVMVTVPALSSTVAISGSELLQVMVLSVAFSGSTLASNVTHIAPAYMEFSVFDNEIPVTGISTLSSTVTFATAGTKMTLSDPDTTR